MTKIKLFAFVAAILTVGGFMTLSMAEDKTPSPAPAALPKLAVQTLEGKGVDADTASALTEVLCTRIMTHKKYQVLCASDVKAILAAKEQTALMGTCNSEDCFEELGKAVDAQYILAGSVSKIESNYLIALSIIGTNDQRVMKRVTHEVSIDAGKLSDGMRKAADELMK